MDRRQELALLPISDAESDILLASIPAERRPDCWWLVRRDGTPVACNNGGWVALFGEMKRTRLFSRLLAWLHLSRLLNWWGDYLTRKRGDVADYLPEGPAPRRYP